MAPLIVNSLMLRVGDTSLPGLEKASHQESVLYAAGLSKEDSAVKQLDMTGEIRLIWEGLA